MIHHLIIGTPSAAVYILLRYLLNSMIKSAHIKVSTFLQLAFVFVDLEKEGLLGVILSADEIYIMSDQYCL